LDRPEWWDWELAFVSHLEDRMEERGFSEVELRTMLADASDVTPARKLGRWRIATRHGGGPWVVVVEPDADEQVTYVITAFPREQSR
jgi:hypothetical protein